MADLAIAAVSTSTTDSKIYDKMDLNKDGKVTDQERLEYLAEQAKNPTATTVASPTIDIVELSSKSSPDKTSSTDSKTFDKMDANKDGTVTAQEASEYAMQQATDATSTSLPSPYSGKSSIRTYA
jgi:CRISPR/Cas system-associated endonuclease Cas3-HD